MASLSSRHQGCVDDLKVAVIVPTYGRPVQLLRCLAALGTQAHPPDQVVIVASAGSSDLGALVRQLDVRLDCVRLIAPDQQGLAAALSAGVSATARETDVVAVTDDDAAPRREWLATLLSHYGPGIGGVGGRDAIGGRDGVPPDRAPVVGRVSRLGRCVGNHHLGYGPPRQVDVLKGVNMSLRRELWRFEHEILGRGAQVHWEMHLCLRSRRLGCQLIYDPAAVVDHYPATRPAGDDRAQRTRADIECAAYNQTVALLAYASSCGERKARWAYRVLIGDGPSPGLARATLGLLYGDSAWKAFGPAQRGVWRALRYLQRGGVRVKNSV